MIYSKLTIRNLKRSIREYLIFMMTVTITMMLMYAFNSLIFHDEVQTLMRNMDGILTAFVSVSVLLVFVIAWLISYVSDFIIKSRSKEFGLYLLSGMKRSTISRMFVLEMFLMGLVALFAGCILGVFFSEILRAMIVSIFDVAYTFHLSFSFKTLGLTFLYFMMMWIVTLFRERRKIMKVTIHELLYQEEKNEPSLSRTWLSKIAIPFTIILFVSGILLTKKAMQVMFIESNDQAMLLGIILLILSIYSCYYGFSALLDQVVFSQKKLKFTKFVLIIYGHIRGRIQKNRMVLATLSLLMICTLLSSSFAIKFYDETMYQIDVGAPYDIQALKDKPLDLDVLHTYYKEKGYQVNEHVYCFYDSGDLQYDLKDTINKQKDLYISYMKASDYQALLELKGYEYRPIQEGGYAILCDKIAKEKLDNGRVIFELKKQDTLLKYSYSDQRNLWNINNDYIVVLPDQYLEKANSIGYSYVATTNKKTKIEMQDELYALLSDYDSILSLHVKADYIQLSLLSTVTFTFALFYMAFVFICISATIVATQQVMDASKQKYEYQLLHKLGMSKKEIYQHVRKQIALYFFLPMLLPIIYIIPLLPIMDLLFQELSGSSNIYFACFVSYILYMIIYFCYYLLAYIGCKRNLEMEG